MFRRTFSSDASPPPATTCFRSRSACRRHCVMAPDAASMDRSCAASLESSKVTMSRFVCSDPSSSIFLSSISSASSTLSTVSTHLGGSVTRHDPSPWSPSSRFLESALCPQGWVVF